MWSWATRPAGKSLWPDPDRRKQLTLSSSRWMLAWKPWLSSLLTGVESYIIPTESVLPLPRLSAGENNRVFTGVKTAADAADGEYKLYRGDTFYGLAEVKNGMFGAVTKLC